MLALPWPFRSNNSSDASLASGTSEQTSSVSTLPLQQNFASLLQYYNAPSTLPPSARANPSLQQQTRQPLGLFDIWKFGSAVASKATEVASEFISHHLWGPRRKTWGIEMTLITSFMRNVAKHSQLADLAMLRRLIGLAGYAPVPSDALVTPVTFRVRPRRLRGILAELSAAETGTRELSGEWVVGKRLWRRLQAEWRASQNRSKRRDARGPRQPRKTERIVLFLHGGAYYMFSAATHRMITIQLSKYTDSRIFVVDYRLAPETRFPGQLDDAVCAYLRLTEELHIPPENIVIAGDSAGGGLSLALLMYLRDNQYPLPAGAILMSPWVDLTMSCDSWDSNAPYDVIPMPTPGDHLEPVSCYLGENMEKYITHPYASPLFGDFHGLPPLLIQSGDSEVLRDEITLLAHKATLAGVEVRHELYEDAVHVFQTFPFLEASGKAFLSCREFVRNVLPLHQSHSPQQLDNTVKAGLEREIDNPNTQIVMADGIAMDDDSADSRLNYSGDDDSTDDGSRERSSDFERPSWVRKTPEAMAEELSRDTEIPTVTASSTSSTQSMKTTPQRSRFRFSLLSPASPEFPPTPAASTPSPVVQPMQHSDKPTEASRPPRNHQRRATGGSSRTHGLSMSPMVATAPTPTIRSRLRAISHPDISSLCQEWANSGPANRTTCYTTDTNDNHNDISGH